MRIEETDALRRRRRHTAVAREELTCFWTQLRVLLTKAWRIKRRNRLGTLVEFGLPIGFWALLVFLKGLIGREVSQGASSNLLSTAGDADWLPPLYGLQLLTGRILFAGQPATELREMCEQVYTEQLSAMLQAGGGANSTAEILKQARSRCRPYQATDQPPAGPVGWMEDALAGLNLSGRALELPLGLDLSTLVPADSGHGVLFGTAEAMQSYVMERAGRPLSAALEERMCQESGSELGCLAASSLLDMYCGVVLESGPPDWRYTLRMNSSRVDVSLDGAEHSRGELADKHGMRTLLTELPSTTSNADPYLKGGSNAWYCCWQGLGRFGGSGPGM